MTRWCSSRRPIAGAAHLAALAWLAASCGDQPPPPHKPAALPINDTRPFTPWHRAEEPMPFPEGEWFWQELLAVAPAPETLPQETAAAAALTAAFERVALLDLLVSEEELPGMVVLARRDPAPLLHALDDPRRDVRYAAARVLLRLMVAKERPEGCPFPQRLVEAAARHLRDTADEVALLHLETVARSGYAWTAPLLLRTFGKVDNHRLTVLRIRAAAKLALAHCYGGVPLLIKALKENTSIQDDINREWDASLQTAWWKDEAMVAIVAMAGQSFGHSPDASDADQVAAVRRIEQWWQEHHLALWSESPAITDPVTIDRIHLLILGFGTFQLRNVDNGAFVLQGLGPKVAPLLFEALGGSSFMIRRHVLGVLASLAPETAVVERLQWLTRVEPFLADPEPSVRVRALEVIGATRLPAALPHLERWLRPEEAILCETALHQLSLQPTHAVRVVLERFATKLPSGHLLTTPLMAARLGAGDLAPLPSYLALLGGEPGPDPRAQLYLSWIVEADGLSEAKSPEQRRAAITRIEAEIRARAEVRSGS